MSPESKVHSHEILWNDEPLDKSDNFVVLFHKPAGYVCSHDEGGRMIYDILPPRWRHRIPVVSSIGRLDKDTTGILLLTDDGLLLHQLSSPKYHCEKIYDVTLERPINHDVKSLFASGTLLLKGESKPCLPASLVIHDDFHVSITLFEGRYHQVKRMFACVGNHVLSLHRRQFSFLTLDNLNENEWRYLTDEEIKQLYEKSNTLH